MTGLVENGVRTQTPVKENDDPEAFPFQTTQTCLNRRVNTRSRAYNVFGTRSLWFPSNRNSGSATRSTTRVWKTEGALVFRENFYGGKGKWMIFSFCKNVVQGFEGMNKKDTLFILPVRHLKKSFPEKCRYLALTTKRIRSKNNQFSKLRTSGTFSSPSCLHILYA